MSSELQLRGWRRMLLPDAAQRDARSWTRPQLDPRMFYRRATQMRNLYSFGTLLRNSELPNVTYSKSHRNLSLLQVQSPVLVVELALDALEGSALRALRLLTVFGFNMTYAVTSPASKEVQSCSALDCRLLGHCYAASDYQGFFCSCFEGYSGADCGAGPACRDAGLCRHGGTCR
ncbi:unnamed protein product [Plutella xylostella]|uniref:(diamondback moth) hypothetical protein n=1 Tax=Plutella xylostella TaxID=51655 RepID=A0A8S4G7J1_PLUXY|nr:unnamed protein product [Plutella xylostella]